MVTYGQLITAGKSEHKSINVSSLSQIFLSLSSEAAETCGANARLGGRGMGQIQLGILAGMAAILAHPLALWSYFLGFATFRIDSLANPE